ncbi:MAG: transglycosylase family protein [Mycobacterium sp.]
MATALLLGASGVAGADTVNWNAVAQCESGGNWAADTGNGAYGGLQIEPAMWDANGGVGGLPSQASEQQQVAVANRILAEQGPKAWPTCLTRGVTGGASAGGAPDEDAGGPPTGSLTHYLTMLVSDAEGGQA